MNQDAAPPPPEETMMIQKGNPSPGGAIVRLGLWVTIVVLAPVAAWAQADLPLVPTYTVSDLGIIPRPFAPSRLLVYDTIQKELGLTDDQKKQQAELVAERLRKLPRLNPANNDMAAFRQAQTAAYRAFEARFEQTLTPAQHERLDQILLQLEGPAAFDRPEIGPMVLPGPSLAQRLKLSDEQAQRTRAIAGEGAKDIIKAAGFPITLDPKEALARPQAIRTFVQSPAFHQAKQKAREAGLAVHEAVLQRIEEVLTDAQRAEYQALRGKPVDLSRLNPDDANARQTDEFVVRAAFRRMGQR
jgi:hypothetical protein